MDGKVKSQTPRDEKNLIENESMELSPTHPTLVQRLFNTDDKVKSRTPRDEKNLSENESMELSPTHTPLMQRKKGEKDAEMKDLKKELEMVRLFFVIILFSLIVFFYAI